MIRKIAVLVTALGALLLSALPASAATGHVGKNTTANNARFEMDWYSSPTDPPGAGGACPSGQYSAGTLTYWNASGSTLRFQTMLTTGVKLSASDVSAGDTVFRVPSRACGTATTKTNVTRLSDGAEWCVYLSQNNTASAAAGRCAGF